ncbi:hypothetical protein BKA67DRAFT_533398 [Truncatella angustata]|uniref:Uncharacterized protein n=1 Tax=Truncatella angustata TaxID=152316 RepID=A0A9P8UU30_9PEZI|nr:uncharacterized protein BKA67DRAFT_533398 [Truncatella angustata]KAH6658238.1 hypothetical protein BKA67DRAFT_533398 [Truncatella angustata]
MPVVSEPVPMLFPHASDILGAPMRTSASSHRKGHYLCGFTAHESYMRQITIALYKLRIAWKEIQLLAYHRSTANMVARFCCYNSYTSESAQPAAAEQGGLLAELRAFPNPARYLNKCDVQSAKQQQDRKCSTFSLLVSLRNCSSTPVELESACFWCEAHPERVSMVQGSHLRYIQFTF